MDWKFRVRGAFPTSASLPADDVLEELAEHASAMYDAAIAAGSSDAEADARVTAQLERWRLDAAALRHRARRARPVDAPPVSVSRLGAGLAQDVRYGVRLLRREPGYALLAILTTALGIALTTVLFSVVHGVLMEPLSWPDADRLVVLRETRGGNAPRFGAFTNTAYLAWREKAATIEDLAAYTRSTVTIAGAGEADRIAVVSATASLFSVLRVQPLIGAVFAEKDEGSPVVVLSESLWRQRFGASPSVIGRSIRLNGQPHTVVGVLQDRFAYPDAGVRAWMPMRVQPADGNALFLFSAVARLRPGVTAAQAAAEGTARGRFAADTGLTTVAIFGSRGSVAISATFLREAVTAEVHQPLIVLLAAVGLLLVTATANVASLQLARATTRRRELAIRGALGAGAGRVTRQLLVESSLLAAAGGATGLALAALLHRALPSVLPADFPRVADLTLDVPAVLFCIAVSMATGIAFGVLPALRARRLNLVESLSEDGTAPVGASGRSKTARVRMAIIAAQVAIACVLLVGASLLARSFLALVSADRGYNPSGVLTATLSLPSDLYSPERRQALASQILERLGTMPGVTDAAFTSELPLTPGGSTSAFTMRSRLAGGSTISAQASPRIVSPGYFRAAGMRVIAGRGLVEADTEMSLPVVVINRAFARRYLGDAALGAMLPMAPGYLGDDDTQATVVGIVDDVRYLTAADSSQPEMFFSYRQLKGRLPVPAITIVVRTPADPVALGPALRSTIRSADESLVPEVVMTMEERMMRGLARPRLYAVLLAAFAAFALVVAAVGLVGVLSYTVAQRSRELAVRTALGARQLDIAGLVLRQGLTVTAGGIAAGILLSLAMTRWLGSLLYGVTPYDGPTYLVVPLLLALVSAGACLAPARRAARVDPLRVLRQG